MELLAILFAIFLFLYLNSPREKPKPKDPWEGLGGAIGNALKSLFPSGEKKAEGGKPNDPWPGLTIVIFAVGATVAGDLGGLEAILRASTRQPETIPQPEPIRQVEPTRQQGQSSQPNANNRSSPNNTTSANSRSYFPPELRERLRECLQANLTEFLGIPTLSGLLDSLSWEYEPNSEFEYQLLVLYTRVQQLRDAIKNCDPSLIEPILETGQENALIDELVVIKDFTYIRAGPGEMNTILARAGFGETLVLDQEGFNSLSSEQKALLTEWQGWLPVFQPTGIRGFVWADDVRKIIRPY